MFQQPPHIILYVLALATFAVTFMHYREKQPELAVNEIAKTLLMKEKKALNMVKPMEFANQKAIKSPLHHIMNGVEIPVNISSETFGSHLQNSRKLDTIGLFYEDNTYSAAPIRDFDTGTDHSCAINIHNKVYCWGSNKYGQLGMGSTTDYPDTRAVSAIDFGDRKPKEVYTGASHTCVLFESDDLACFGYNFFGQLGIGSTVSIGTEPDHMGNNLQIIDFGTGRKVKKVSIGLYHACVILDDNSLKCWGNGETGGRTGYGDQIKRGIKAHQMGDNLPPLDYGEGVVKDVFAGFYTTCILLESKECKCWGANTKGTLGQGDTRHRVDASTVPIIDVGGPVIDIQSGYLIVCAMLENKGVKCWGNNNYGQLGLGNKMNKGDGSNEMGDKLPFVNFGSDTAKELAVNYESVCVVLEDGNLKCWGRNFNCALGSETTDDIGADADFLGDKLPFVDLGGRTVKKIKGYGRKWCAILSDDTFTCWGMNIGGSLGQGDLNNRGCNVGDMGSNLPELSMPCEENSISVDITTGAYSNYTSMEVKHLNEDKLVMKARKGYYTMENHIYEHDSCVPDGTYQVQIEHTLGNWSGGYEIKFKGNLITQKNPNGYFWKDRYVFSSCSNEMHCDDQFSCTSDICNLGTSQCDFNASFSTSCRSYGSPSVLVLRSVASDSSTTSTLEELRDRFYGIDKLFSMRSQFLDCSYDKFDLVPFTGQSKTNALIVNGTINITIDQTSIGEQAGTVSSKILEKATDELGELSSQFDFVIVCLPPGVVIGDSPHWKAYAFVDGYISIYNDLNCIYPSVQIHEIGHNLGLSHSNDEENYGDTSGNMGISYSLLDGPAKCFNAPKSLDLRWYVDGDLTFDFKDLIDKEVHLVGVSDYNRKDFKSTHLKIINCENGFDYFLGFNRKISMNSGTSEGGDKILITRRRIGDYYDDSTMIAKLGHLQRFTIFGLGPDGDWDLQIMPNIYEDEEKDLIFGRVSFYLSTRYCIKEENCDDNNLCTIDECVQSHNDKTCKNTPKSCSDCGAPIFLEVTTNDYPLEILWDIENVLTKRIVRSSEYYMNEFSSYNFSACFEYGMYLFSIYYTNSTDAFYTNATFKLLIGDTQLDDGNITELIYAESIFTICATDTDCMDYDGCTIDFCDTKIRLCNNSFIPLSEKCVDCFWVEVNLTTDNFPEETKWNIYDYETNSLVETGDPYPSYFHAFGRRKAPTKAGRRKAPTKSGRRKAPTKSGRRKAPTRSSAVTFSYKNNRRLDEDEDDEIFKAICLEQNIKYWFIITDSFGDGICCSEGEGWFAVTLEDKVIKRGSNFTTYEEVFFKFTLSESACEDNDQSTYFVYDPEINACLYYTVECSIFGAFANVIIKSDIYADDTIWQVTLNGTIQMQGSMYELAYEKYESEKCLPYGSYLFSISDPPADGMAFCFDYECGYDLVVNNKTVRESDGSFSLSRNHIFGICTSDEQCNDNDECTFDFCDIENKICIYNALSCSECNKQTVLINIFTDVLFSLTSWNLMETTNNTEVASDGPFVKKYKRYQQRICVTTGFYRFTVRNSEGRGMTICKKNLNCGYSVTVNNETIIDSDGSFEFKKSHSFVICHDDNDCIDDNSCSIGICNNMTRLCNFDKLPCASCGKKSLKIIIDTDGNATETSWNLKISENNSIIATGGKYAKNYSQYIYDECAANGEYIYTLFDKSGDGFASCYNADKKCGYSIAVDDQIIIESEGDFSSELSHTLLLCDDDSICNKVTSTFVSTASPTKLPIEINNHYLSIQSFAVGFHHTCALTDKGLIFCFGLNSYGQLGYGDSINRSSLGKDAPSVDIGESNRAKEIFAGAFHTCVLLEVEDIICWGNNVYGQLGVGSTVNVGSSIDQMGDALRKVDLGPGRKVKKVSLGYLHSCALLDDGTVKCWGHNAYGQLGYNHQLTIGDDPSHMSYNLSSVDLGSDKAIHEISAGTYHTCALQAFQVKCWGKNSHGQLGYGDKLNRGDIENTMGNNLPAVNVSATTVHISAGNSFTCIVTYKGKSKCWGQNKFGHLGYGDNLQRGSNQNDISDALPFLDIGDDFNIIYLTRGSYSICGLSSNSTIKCWGWNTECSLGLGDDQDRVLKDDLGNHLPLVDLGSRKPKQIEMFHWHVCVLFEDKTLSCYGFNRYGQLGQGHEDSIGCDLDDMGDGLDPIHIVETQDWLIEFDGIESQNKQSKLFLQYHVSRNVGPEQFVSKVLDRTCTTQILDNTLNVTAILTDTSNSIYLKGRTLVEMDFHTMKLSDYWIPASNSSGFINFCVRTDLFRSNQSSISISFQETIVLVDIDLERGFTNFKINDTKVKKEVISHVNKKEVGFEVAACICNEVAKCIESPNLTLNSEFYICAHPFGNDVQIENFFLVRFYQDGVLKFSPVSNGKSMELTKTVLTGSLAVMKTRLPSMFFQAENPSDLFIEGEIQLKFKHRRYLSGMESDFPNKYGSEKATFRLNVSLVKQNYSLYRRLGFCCASIVFTLIIYFRMRKENLDYISLATEDW